LIEGLVGDFVIGGEEANLQIAGESQAKPDKQRREFLSWELEKEDGIQSPRNRDPKDRHLERAVLEAVKAIP
jgi:hypothetical protein